MSSAVTMGGGGEGHVPPQPRSVPPPPIQNFEKTGPHLRLQDTKCSNIDMPPPPPRKSGGPPSAPWKMDPSYATANEAFFRR